MFQARLLCAYNYIRRQTEKYTYTIEVHEIIQYYYRINYRPVREGALRGYSATMYETQEAAEQAAHQNPWYNEGREWYVTKEANHTFVTKCHRYKRH